MTKIHNLFVACISEWSKKAEGCNNNIECLETCKKELLENLDRRNEELDAVVNHLSDEELETLNNLLDKIRNNH